MFYKLIKSRFCTTNKNIYYQKVISTAQDPNKVSNLIILHGFLGNGSLYKHLAEYSQIKKNFNSYLLDLPNHGKSYRTNNVSMLEMGQAVAQWIKKQNFQNNITLVGHSLGGRTIYAMTKLYPQLQQKVKKIIILDAAPHSYLNYQFHLDTQNLLQKMLKVDLSHSKQQIQKQLKQISPNPIWYQTLLSSIDFQNKQWIFNLSELQKKYKNYIGFGIEESEWKEKVIVLRGTKTEFVTQKSIQLLKKIYQNLQIIDLNCGHHIQLEKPLSVINTINKK